MTSFELLSSPDRSAPFDAIADSYDETFTDSMIGFAQRSAVWSVLENTFRRGEHVVEIGCGTGVDACFLAQRGVRVTALDSSPRMIEITARKVQLRNLEALVYPRLLAAEELDHLDGCKFDGAFSNFGALNCVPDPGALAASLANLLNPGAIALLCWMGPSCLWELVFYLLRGDPAKAFRRLHSDGVTARLAEGSTVSVVYPAVRSLTRAFAPKFRLKSLRGIGVLVPPSYCEGWARRFPRMLKLAASCDSVAGRCPAVRLMADHLLLAFERTA